jgi:hypothetical protein
VSLHLIDECEGRLDDALRVDADVAVQVVARAAPFRGRLRIVAPNMQVLGGK